MEHKFPYNWKMSDGYPSKGIKYHGLKVFSCFACGGGSTMGYKLAGYDVIGANDIDSKMADVCKANHSPKYYYLESITTLKDRDDFPDDFYNLDILDGSPPCSSFSMAGNREKDWGKKKKFREGQAKQVLDTLFFDFIELANKLRPKVVIAENVKGIIQGKAIKYTAKIRDEFDKSGYFVDWYLLDASKMGVPQRRERVFFIAVRKDICPKSILGGLFGTELALKMDFNEPGITFGDISIDLIDFPLNKRERMIWDNKIEGDESFSCVYKRMENRETNWNWKFIYENHILKTIASSDGSRLISFHHPRMVNIPELISGGTFPVDYRFNGKRYANIKYLIGMSVPPVMMAQVANQVKIQIFDAM